ncbi:unnamed protein product [Pocillopora meandrina]|uniref:Uncharacterized protein n=1 Tax=Pocillopora meandrina TaxID=46732 RepID=A0AAU9WXU5_9CNID|nr:unnamed protein product [Pocillopora meandrina]
MSKRGAEVGDVPNEEGMDITTADSEPMLRRGDVGYEEQVSEIQRKVLHRRYTGIAQDLDNSSFFSYDTEATTTPRCVKVLQNIDMATAGAATRAEEFEESEVVDDSGYIYVIREQLGRKRSFDQIATYRELKSSESPVKMSLSSMNGPAQPSPEKLPVVIASHDGLSENISSDLNLVSGWAEKSAEKSDVELSNERPLMNVQQELGVPSNTILFKHSPLQQPPQMGIPVAPAPTGGNNALNTVPAQQCLEMPLFPASNSPGLQSVPQASTFPHQLQRLHISSASSQQPQNIVTSEASTLGSSKAVTTLDITEISQQLSWTEVEGDRNDLEGGHQETENFKSPDLEEPNVEKTDPSQVAGKESAGEASLGSRHILEIRPSEEPIEGGSPFVLVFGQALPPEVKSARAEFGEKADADLERINDFNLKGRIPASDKPGKVTVTVYSSTGGILGKTDFDYYDQGQKTLLRLVKDPKLQSEFFYLWADFMVDKTKRSEGQDLSEPLAGDKGSVRVSSGPSCTGYMGDEESLSSKSSGSESSFSEDNSSTASSEDLDENPTSEECCGPEGVAKYEGKNEAEEESLTKISTDLVGEDLIRLESKPKVNEQERGGSSRKEEFFPGEHERDVGNLCSIARESRRQNIQQQNSGCNFDQSSIAEKTRRAKERNNEEETGDLNGAPLWQKQNKPTI